jgi:hypothetical protein
METTEIAEPGLYWYFDPKLGRVPPKLVELVEVDGALFVRFDARRTLHTAAGMAGDFSGPLPAEVPLGRREAAESTRDEGAYTESLR